MADSNYTHGEMDIKEQARTFHGFMRMTVWGSAHLVILLTFLTLHFSVGTGWFTALGLAFVLGVVIGLLLKMKSAWYAALVGVGILGGVIGLLATLVSALNG